MTIVWHATMSLDGFIAGPDDSMDWAFEHAGPNPVADDVMNATGAILAGRRWYDVATAKYSGRHGIYGGAWSGPVFVLTHEPPADPEDSEITFLTTGFEEAVRTAADAAGGKNLELFGATIGRQAIEAQLLNEIVVHLTPVLLGEGVRLYGGPGASRADLERTSLQDVGQLVSLRYRVKRG